MSASLPETPVRRFIPLAQVWLRANFSPWIRAVSNSFLSVVSIMSALPSQSIALPFLSPSVMSLMELLIISFSPHSFFSTFCLPLSMNDSCSTSFTMVVSTLELSSILSFISALSSSLSPSPLSISSENPTTALSGVRMSWLRFLVNADFILSSSWAWSRASVSSWFFVLSFLRCSLLLM